MTEHYIPQERDLPAGRLTQLKEDLMTQNEHDLEMEPRAAPVVTHRRWRRIGLTAAALAAGFGLATSLVLGGHDSASANTAVRTADGAIIITIREGKHPKDLQRRLTDLGVPAVVDFLESGFACDPARSTGWVQEPPGEALFTWAPTSPDDDPQLVLHPDQLQPGETAVFEFQIDEHQDRIAANVNLRLSTSPVGPCVPVPDASIVDAEGGIAGG
ncbi:MAG TPA: hypothetical protein VFH30_06130 [Acidimicrobiales bacterium]|nr:hypothetical protein [Acidimicrobiales bacterium]